MMELKTFAVAVYSEPGVEQTCLELQDQHHVDVPLLLYCGWYGACCGRIPDETLARARQTSAQLSDHVIKPLRKARRWMKTRQPAVSDSGPGSAAETDDGWQALREQIKASELKAELLLLDMLGRELKETREQGEGRDMLADIQHNLRLLTGAAVQPAPLTHITEACIAVSR